MGAGEPANKLIKFLFLYRIASDYIDPIFPDKETI